MIVAQFDGQLDIGQILEACAGEARGSTGGKRIEPLEVVSSSGSYRYGRWSEPFAVAYGAPSLGWSSASRRAEHVPWITIDTLGDHQFTRLGIVPRDWTEDRDLRNCFPAEIEVAVSGDGVEWMTVARQPPGPLPSDPVPQYVALRASGRFVRVRVTRLNRRRNGRYVCQVSKLELWGWPVEASERPQLAVGDWQMPVADGGMSIEKRGIYYSEGDSTAVVSWRLEQGAALPARALLEGRLVLLVVSGSIVVSAPATEERVVDAGQWVAQPPRTPVAIRNAALDQPATILEIRARPESAEAWISL